MFPFEGKKVRPSRLVVITISFDAEASYFGVHIPLESSSQRHESPDDALDASKVQPAPVVSDVYSTDPSDTSFRYSHADHIVKHVWHKEVK